MKINEIVGLKDKFIEEGIIMEILRTAYVYAGCKEGYFPLTVCVQSLLPEHLKNDFVELLEKRISVLEK